MIVLFLTAIIFLLLNQDNFALDNPVKTIAYLSEIYVLPGEMLVNFLSASCVKL